MKTVKFKELPGKVQEFLRRESAYTFKTKLNYRIDLDWLHKWDKWSLATDDERLAYAEWKYPKGTGLNYKERGFAKSIGKPYIASRDRLVADLTDHKNRGGNCNPFYPIYENGVWAELVSESEKEDASIKREKEQILSEDSEPTFKAGDEVEGFVNGLGGSRVWELVIFTGGKTTGGEFVCENRFGELEKYMKIRVPDLDEPYREIAKEIIGNARVHEFTSIEYITVESAESMLIEALKKGKGL